MLNYEAVESLMRDRHITKRELAKVLGMKENTVTAAFRNNRKATFSNDDIAKISELLGTAQEDILFSESKKRIDDLYQSIFHIIDLLKDAGFIIGMNQICISIDLMNKLVRITESGANIKLTLVGGDQA